MERGVAGSGWSRGACLCVLWLGFSACTEGAGGAVPPPFEASGAEKPSPATATVEADRPEVASPQAGPAALAALAALSRICDGEERRSAGRAAPSGLTASARSTHLDARAIPRDPTRDSELLPADPERAARILRGFRLFMETPTQAPGLVGGQLACRNCHLVAGQREGALPLVGVARVYPEYNERSNLRDFSSRDRIVACLIRSCDAAARTPPGKVAHEGDRTNGFPPASSPEVAALEAYLEWLSEGAPEPRPKKRMPPLPARQSRADLRHLGDEGILARGRIEYEQRCIACHDEHGKPVPGVAEIVGAAPGPLWGAGSWNDGAGMARVCTLARFLRRAMPYSDPGSLEKEAALLIALYIDSQPRPVFPHKDMDYPGGQPSEDALYYHPVLRHAARGRRDSPATRNPVRHPWGGEQADVE